MPPCFYPLSNMFSKITFKVHHHFFAMRLGMLLGLGFLLFSQSALAQKKTVGSERCKTCHEFEYQVWASGPHARAGKSLSGEQLADVKCNSCHVSATAEQEMAKGVQCEHCHGSGYYYQRDYVMKDRELARAVGLVEQSPEHCVQCHTEGAPNIIPFDYKKAWSRIDHGPEAKKRWLELQGKTSESQKALPEKKKTSRKRKRRK